MDADERRRFLPVGDVIPFLGVVVNFCAAAFVSIDKFSVTTLVCCAEDGVGSMAVASFVFLPRSTFFFSVIF